MIAQQELQHLLTLPPEERQLLIELLHNSLLQTSDANPLTPAPDATLNNKVESSTTSPRPANPLLAMIGMFDGGPGDTAERADEICRAEISRRSGFTTKPPLDDEER